MPTINHTITVTIDGVDRSSLLLADSLYVRSSVANNTDVCEFLLRDSSSNGFKPLDWDEVTIDVNATRIFGGYIIQRDVDSSGGGSAKRAVWQVQCKDWSILLDTKIVNRQYTETDDSTIIDSLFDTYLPDDGFDTAGAVSTVRQDIDINFENVTLREALNNLAAVAGANWHIGPDKSIYWYEPTAPDAAAFNIDTVSPDNSASFDVLEGSLKRSIDSTQIINRVRVIGAEAAQTALQTDTFAANGTASVFGPLTKKPHSIWSVQYTIDDDDDTSETALTSQIGIAPGDKLHADGGTFTVVANLESRKIAVKDASGNVPKSGTNVVVKYYYTIPVEVTRNKKESQGKYGRIFETMVYDENLTTQAEAEAYGDRLLEEYANGRETIRFDVAEHGLSPGRLLSVNTPVMGIHNTYFEPHILLDNNDLMLREDSDELFTENSGEAFNYLIQEVQFRGVATGANNFMVVTSVEAGKVTRNLIDSLSKIPGFSAGIGRPPARSTPGRLSNIAPDMGEIVAGRALFTDGGTAQFAWGTPNGATGAVIGLEDTGGNAYGALYIYEGGTVKAKLGRMTGLSNIGTITPTGWGIYTNNGYFSGQVVASSIVGGTVTGGVFTGGTISNGTISAAYIDGGTVSGIALVGQTIEGAQIIGGTITSVLLDSSQIQSGTITSSIFTGGTLAVSAGSIGGFTIANNQLWSNGGTISTGSVVNSSNPGVYMGTAGLFGFGTLGMTFGLWSDPARAPWFSSGTINNVVYEVYESGIVRTGSAVFTDGGLQMDNSGLFGVSPITGAGAMLLENGDNVLIEDNRGVELYGLKFALDSVTGRLYAEEAWITGDINATSGRFTGTVEASQITGGTVNGSYINGGTITSVAFAGNTITGNTITGGTVSAAQFSGGTVSGALISGGTVSGGFVTGGTVSGGFVTGGTVSAARLTGGTVSGAVVSGGSVIAGQMIGGTVTGGFVSGGTVSGPRLTGGTVSGALVSGGTVSGALVTGGTVSAAGGTITLNDSGLRFSEAGGTAITSPGYINWIRGGTVLTSDGMYYDTSFSIARQYSTTGVTGSVNGVRNSTVRGVSNETVAVQTTTKHEFYVDGGNPRLEVGINETIVRGHVLPLLTDTYTLGNSSLAWDAIYLSDGTDEWRITINSSGNIVTTKV